MGLCNITNTHHRGINRTGSGRLLLNNKNLKMMHSSSSFDSKNWRDNNNNQKEKKTPFRRTASTNCLQENNPRVYANRAVSASRDA